jgi:phage gp36-like protein
MFLSQAELKSTIYDYQVDEITEGDDAIVEQAIEAAIDEVKSYLTPGGLAEWDDGRKRYDVTAIFGATGNSRNALILAHVKTIAKWWIVQLSNPDIIYEQVKERYDRSVEFLTKVAKGIITIGSLPEYTPPATDGNGNPLPPPEVAVYGSRQKFNHE